MLAYDSAGKFNPSPDIKTTTTHNNTLRGKHGTFFEHTAWLPTINVWKEKNSVCRSTFSAATLLVKDKPVHQLNDLDMLRWFALRFPASLS